MFSCYREMPQLSLICLLLSSLELSRALNLLGAGEGPGSCPAPPFRGKKLNWPNGCPLGTPCCNEYGYCVTEGEGLSGAFRDCNGLSNGATIPEEVIKLEAFYAAIQNGAIDNLSSEVDADVGEGKGRASTSDTPQSTEDPAVVRLLADDDILEKADVRDVISGQGGGECGVSGQFVTSLTTGFL